jgi:hypothetical protein
VSSAQGEVIDPEHRHLANFRIGQGAQQVADSKMESGTVRFVYPSTGASASDRR